MGPTYTRIIYLLTSSPVLCESKNSMSCLMMEENRAFLRRTASLSPDTDSTVMYTNVETACMKGYQDFILCIGQQRERISLHHTHLNN